jgi:uncharacterized protein (TIGR00375 family)
MKVYLDLHIHSKYSTAVSREMNLPEIAREAARKGVKIVGTGDCLFPKWLDEIKELPNSEGVFRLGGTYFILSVEVEDSSRVHHIILVPGLSKAEELRERFASHSSTLDTDGRPKLHMDGAEIADIAFEAECLLGPSHSFTPWTGIYAHYKSIKKCYLEKSDHIKFIELGLSADTDYADRIGELNNLTFLSNSDAHSPKSNKLAREFNEMEISAFSFQEMKMAICREKGRRTTLNVGLYPEEGKYNRTACSSCYRQFGSSQMDEFSGRCPFCNGIIKLGVRDRIDRLADYQFPAHPDHRPPYLHLIPLTEIIAMALGVKTPYTTSVQKCWNELVAERTEIDILLWADLSNLGAEPRVVKAIDAFRSGKVIISPGGGGKYGEIHIPIPSQESLISQSHNQTSLLDY